jgi:hypothetical protein
MKKFHEEQLDSNQRLTKRRKVIESVRVGTPTTPCVGTLLTGSDSDQPTGWNGGCSQCQQSFYLLSQAGIKKILFKRF